MFVSTMWCDCHARCAVVRLEIVFGRWCSRLDAEDMTCFSVRSTDHNSINPEEYSVTRREDKIGQYTACLEYTTNLIPPTRGYSYS